MNSNMLRYLLSDASTGLMRNKGGTIASILFIALSMSFVGIFLLLRVLVGDVTSYLNTQLSMKVYIEQSVSTEEVAKVLEDKSFVKSIAIEEGDDLLDRLSFFFEKRDYLLDAFADGKVNDAIRLTLHNAEDMDEVATALQQIEGIEKVVYPQQLAILLQQSLEKLTLYGMIISVVLVVVTYLMIYTTFHLALYRREKELKVKLLVGMNPKLLRTQFLIEGFMLSFIGAIFASAITYSVYHFAFASLNQLVPFLNAITAGDLWLCLSIAIAMGIIMSLLASYFATRKWIRHA